MYKWGDVNIAIPYSLEADGYELGCEKAIRGEWCGENVSREKHRAVRGR